jgi:hypothetical protein
MKKLILVLLASLVIALPATAQKTRSLLAFTTQWITVTGEGSTECVHFHYSGNYVTQTCGWQYGGWTAPRNATITELEVLVMSGTYDLGGDCGLVVVTPGLDDSVWDNVVGGPYYTDLGGEAPTTSVRNRVNTDIDVTAGLSYGFYFQEWTDVPSYCITGETDPIIQLLIWGEWTE